MRATEDSGAAALESQQRSQLRRSARCERMTGPESAGEEVLKKGNFHKCQVPVILQKLLPLSDSVALF